jgi:hypothetical protein
MTRHQKRDTNSHFVEGHGFLCPSTTRYRSIQQVESMLSEELRTQLTQYGITGFDEVTLREALEARAETYTLIKLAPWPARRWKCKYRLLMGEKIHDAQGVAEAYALGLLSTFE